MQVLVIDECRMIAAMLAKIFAGLDKSIHATAVSGLDDARQLLDSDSHFDVAIVAVSEPGRNAIRIPRSLKAICPRLVTIVITVDDSSSTALELVRAGIQDCIPRYELTPQRLLRTIKLARERGRREESLRRLACIDSLTGGLNRRGLIIAAQSLHDYATATQEHVALLTIDLDHFKQINDRYGHPAGDKILKTTCLRISHCIRKHDVVGRAGGDEFWLLLHGPAGNGSDALVAEKLLRHIEGPVLIDGITIHVGASIGIARAPWPGSSVDDWIRQSDKALYEAKNNGKNRWCIYTNKSGNEKAPRCSRPRPAA